MMAQVFVKGFRADILRRLLCFNLFWHALDIIWVALFTVVYLSEPTHERYFHDDARPADLAPGDEHRLTATSQSGSAATWSGSCWRAADGRLVLRRGHRPDLEARHSRRADRAGGRADGRAPRILPAHHTAPDNTNNVLALAFGVLIVVLVIGGSLWIMAHLNHNMMPMDKLMQMQR